MLIRWPNDSLVHGNSLADKAAIWPAIAAEVQGSATSAEVVRVIVLEAGEVATGREAVERIASAVGISRAVAAGTEMPLVVVVGDIADLTRAVAVIGVAQACLEEVGASVEVAVALVVVVVGADRWPRLRDQQRRSTEWDQRPRTVGLPNFSGSLGRSSWRLYGRSCLQLPKNPQRKVLPRVLPRLRTS